MAHLIGDECAAFKRIDREFTMRTVAFEHARKLADVSSELLRHRRGAAPRIAAKAMLARFRGIELSRFLMLGMYNQRIARWADCMGYIADLEPGLRTINWSSDGKRLTVDKLITAERFAEASIPSAPLIAVIGRDAAAHPHQHRFPVLTSIDQIATVLAVAPDKLFAKPATGWRGDGVMGPQRTPQGWRVSDQRLSDRELAARLLKAAPKSGLLLQTRVQSHRDLTPIGGHLGLGCVRVNTALTTSGVEVVFIFGKIMGAEGLVDNFSGGKFGNMLAHVDVATGQITRAYGRKRGQKYLMEPVTHHPVTGTALLGFRFPMWSEVMALATHVAESFPEAPLIGSDIAITDKGPIVIEVQSDWDANVPQLTLDTGLRPLLRNLVPKLVLSDELKQRAMQQMGLSGERIPQRRVTRAPRA